MTREGGVSERVVGWFEALGYVVSIAVLSIVYAMAVEAGAHVTAFILISTIISGAALLLLVGPGKDGIAIMLSPASWLLGLLHIAMEGAYCFALLTLSPAETSLLVRLSVPVAMAASYVLLARRPGVWQVAGATIVTGAVVFVIAQMNMSTQLSGILACLSCAITVTFRALASEWHPWNRAARTIKGKLQVTGLLVLVTAIASLVAVGIAMALVSAGAIPPNAIVPQMSDFLHGPTLILSVIVGAAIFSAMNFLQFSSVVKIGTESLIVASALMPMATLGLQQAAGAIGLIKVHDVPPHLLVAMAMVLVGIVVVMKGDARSS